MTENPKLPSSLFEHNPWETQINPLWPASAYILHRNVANYCFPPKLAAKDADALLGIVKEALLSLKELEQPLFFPAKTLPPLDKEFLFEHFLCLESFQNMVDGQAVVLDHSQQLLILLNSTDHLQLHILDSHGESEKSWNRLSQIETSLSRTLNLAYSTRFGYLTANLEHAGTGLTIHHFLHLPALIHMKQLQEFLKQTQPDFILADLEGSAEDFIGDLLVLSNHYTLGVTEENMLQTLNVQAMKLVAAEKMLRTHLEQSDGLEMKDLVSRAYGLLQHSHQLQIKEALNALSLIKLGLSLNWVSGLTDAAINKIFFNCRRAHLAHLYQTKNVDLSDLPAERASYIHKELQKLTIHI